MALSVAGGPWTMRCGFFALGFACGLYMPSAIATITSLIDRQHWGKAIAVHELAPNLAFFSAPFIAELFLTWLTWRAALGAAALALYAALEKFDFTQLNAAQDLGARPDQAFRHILLPQIRTGIITACIFVFIPILGEFLTPTLVGGAQGSLIANLVVNFFRQAQIPEGSALAIVIAVFVTIVLIVFRRSLRVEDVVARG